MSDLSITRLMEMHNDVCSRLGEMFEAARYGVPVDPAAVDRENALADELEREIERRNALADAVAVLSERGLDPWITGFPL